MSIDAEVKCRQGLTEKIAFFNRDEVVGANLDSIPIEVSLDYENVTADYLVDLNIQSVCNTSPAPWDVVDQDWYLTTYYMMTSEQYEEMLTDDTATDDVS